MGWTSYYVGSGCNRKEECMKYVNGFRKDGKPTATLIKSVMKGTTFYALMETVEKKEQFIFCLLTKIQQGEFYYKDIQCNPCETGVPTVLLKLFKPSNEADAEWKEKCLKENKEEKSQEYKIGTILKCKIDWRDIEWSGKQIKKGEEFYLKIDVKNPFSKRKTKIYRIMNQENLIQLNFAYGDGSITDDEILAKNNGSPFHYRNTNYVINSSLFKCLKVLEVVKK